jgi:hypothetical protein
MSTKQHKPTHLAELAEQILQVVPLCVPGQVAAVQLHGGTRGWGGLLVHGCTRGHGQGAGHLHLPLGHTRGGPAEPDAVHRTKSHHD